jgi:catechol 2,3-dioxygenase-like lactoylglutathione lyase family enzyme
MFEQIARLSTVCLLLSLALSARAQIAPPNAAGVSMGHLHYLVRDVAAETEFWTRLGGERSSFGPGEMVTFPNLVVLIGEGAPQGGTDGSVVNHVAFRVESLADLEARGFELELNDQYPGIASVYTPSGERIELFDDKIATNIGFELAPGVVDPVAERHNQPLTAPIVSHHMHFYLPESEVLAARDWYVEHFGATPGKRWRYDAADLPGINLNFSAAAQAQAPTTGRRLDHIGFEIAGLEAFCRQLEAAGVSFDRPYAKLPSGFALAFLTDPWGTTIELTEGLGDL